MNTFHCFQRQGYCLFVCLFSLLFFNQSNEILRELLHDSVYEGKNQLFQRISTLYLLVPCLRCDTVLSTDKVTLFDLIRCRSRKYRCMNFMLQGFIVFLASPRC